MISFLKKILTKGTKFNEFQAVSGHEMEFSTVLFKIKNTQLDVSSNHWLLCLEPATFGIWLPNNTPFEIVAQAELIFTKSTSSRSLPYAKVKLKFAETITLPEGNLHLFTAIQTKLYISNPLFRSIYYHFYYKKPGINHEKFKVLAAAFCYPRKVRLISYQEEGHKNHFPMDLLGPIYATKHYVLGLRHSNPSLEKILESKKVVVGDFDIEKKETIYRFAKNHFVNQSQNVPIPTKNTELYCFEIPNWIKSYCELNIQMARNLGSQMLLLGQITNEVMEKHEPDPLYHIHFLYYLEQKRS